MNHKSASIVAALLFALVSCAGPETNPKNNGENSDAAPGDASDAGPDVASDDGGEPDADAAPSATSLIHHDEWTEVDEAGDPFSDRPANVVCDPINGYGAEDLTGEYSFGVDMTACDYLTVAQPTLADVSAGDTLTVRVFHFALTGDTPSHLAVRLGDDVIWEETVEQPTDSGILFDEIEAPADVAAGSDVYFHVHNHGDNEYNLIEISVEGS